MCRTCTLYASRITGACRQERAEDARDQERANFCDCFTPRPDAYRPRGPAAARTAWAQLEALFGETPAPGTVTMGHDRGAAGLRGAGAAVRSGQGPGWMASCPYRCSATRRNPSTE